MSCPERVPLVVRDRSMDVSSSLIDLVLCHFGLGVKLTNSTLGKRSPVVVLSPIPLSRFFLRASILPSLHLVAAESQAHAVWPAQKRTWKSNTCFKPSFPVGRDPKMTLRSGYAACAHSRVQEGCLPGALNRLIVRVDVRDDELTREPCLPEIRRLHESSVQPACVRETELAPCTLLQM